MAAAELAIDVLRLPRTNTVGFAVAIVVSLAAVIILISRRTAVNLKKAFAGVFTIAGGWILAIAT